MPRARKRPDGLPHRVYERHGARVYSVGRMGPDGKWEWRLSCPAGDKAKIAETRREAIDRANKAGAKAPAEGSFSALADAWLRYQEEKPIGSEGRRADSTLAENRREIKKLKSIMGGAPVVLLEKTDAYAYLDAAEKKGRAAKANKEIALARSILEYGIRIGVLKVNPFDGVEKLITAAPSRLVTDQELALAVEVGRHLGGPQQIVALALRTAWLCVRRSVEVRALKRDMITDEGVLWEGAKRKRGTLQMRGLIEWSPALRETIAEVLAIKRNKLAGSWYVFGNLSGQKYTKGGWKKTLSVLMDECVKVAAQRKIPFEKFSLQDCRPKGVSDKQARGDKDTVDAALHTSERMVRQVYDRRRVRVAKPAA